MIFFVVLDSTNFEEQFQVCQSLYLTDYEKHLENFLLHDHPKGPSQLSRSVLTADSFKILLLAIQFDLDELKEAFMAKEPRLANPFEEAYGRSENTLMFQDIFRDADRLLKYEIIKNTISFFSEVEKKNKVHKAMELEVLFNFFDFMIYEKIIQNNVVPSRKRSWSLVEASVTSGAKKAKQTPNNFLTRSLKSDVSLIVDDVKLYISPFTLKENSLVFKRMLESSFKEGREQTIELPDKNLDEIVQFLHLLKFPRDIKGNFIWLFVMLFLQCLHNLLFYI